MLKLTLEAFLFILILTILCRNITRVQRLFLRVLTFTETIGRFIWRNIPIIAIVLLVAVIVLVKNMTIPEGMTGILNCTLLALLTVASFYNYIRSIRVLDNGLAKDVTIGLLVLHTLLLVLSALSMERDGMHIYFLWGIYGGYCWQNICQIREGSTKEKIIGVEFLLQENAPAFAAYALLWTFSLSLQHYSFLKINLTAEFLQGAALFHIVVSAFRYHVVVSGMKDPLEVALGQLDENGQCAVLAQTQLPLWMKWVTKITACAYLAAGVAWLCIWLGNSALQKFLGP